LFKGFHAFKAVYLRAVQSAVIETAIDIARGVAYLHSPNRRLVHRDISPSNILLMSEFNSRGFRAVLSDFGLSTIMALALTHKTSDTKGTVAYMPPECFTDSIVSTSTDIYSMGVLLLFMLTGKEPYRGMTTGQIVHAKMSAGHDQVPILNELERSENTCVHGLVDIIKNCTHFDRKQRMSAAELCRQLEDLALEQASE